MKFYQSFKSILLLTILFLLTNRLVYSQQDNLLQPGAKAPVCELNATDGQSHTFPVSGNWNLIFYWSLFCHSCLDEIPEIQTRLASPGADVQSFFISLDTSRMEKALINFCKKRNIERPILMEQIASDSYVTADQWGVVMTPSVFIVAPDGKIAYSHAGPMDMDKFFADFEIMRKGQQDHNNCAH
jgi:peroxiredoxin